MGKIVCFQYLLVLDGCLTSFFCMFAGVVWRLKELQRSSWFCCLWLLLFQSKKDKKIKSNASRDTGTFLVNIYMEEEIWFKIAGDFSLNCLLPVDSPYLLLSCQPPFLLPSPVTKYTIHPSCNTIAQGNLLPEDWRVARDSLMSLRHPPYTHLPIYIIDFPLPLHHPQGRFPAPSLPLPGEDWEVRGEGYAEFGTPVAVVSQMQGCQNG